MIISKAALVSGLEFDLDQLRGKVVTSEEVKIPTLQTTIVIGLTIITGHCEHVHVLIEPPPKCVNVFILGNTSELRPRRSYVTIVLQNSSGKDVTLKPQTQIGTVTTANLVPSTQVSNAFDLDERERVPCISAQVKSTDIPGKTHQGNSDPKHISQKLDLSGIEEWELQLQQEA